MRVLAVTNMYPTPGRPGEGAFIESQVAGLRRRGFEVDVLFLDRVSKGRRVYATSGREVRRALATRSYDVVHAMYGGLLAQQVVRSAGSVPVVVSFCGSDLLGEDGLGAGLGVVASRRAAARAAAVIVKSKALADALPLVEPEKVEVLPNGVDPERFVALNREACRRKLAWSPEGFHVLFSGASREVKRPALARAGIERLVGSGIPAELKWLEGVAHKEVPTWINASDVVLLTSLHEGSPNIVKEALACDVPVVSVDVGDVAERIGGIEGCHLVEPEPSSVADRLGAVYRRAGRIHGRERVEELFEDRVAKRLGAIYSRVAGRRTEGLSLTEDDHGPSRWPAVTVMMPIRNEASFIARSLRGVLVQDYEGPVEVFVVDGDSDDDTVAVATAALGCWEEGADYRLAPGPRRAQIMVNPRRIVPTSLNMGLEAASGDVVVRVDGHCEIPGQYLTRCVEALRRHGAACVGGPMVTIGTGRVGRGIAAAQSSAFGVGGAAFRTGAVCPRRVDTVAFGAYPRSVFDSIGGFDEELRRNQDDEFNFRLAQAGGSIWIDPTITSRYHSRSSFGSLWKQYFEYGLYKVRVIQKRGEVPAWRQAVPPAFVLCLGAGITMALMTGEVLPVGLVVGTYLVADGVMALRRGDGDLVTSLAAAAAYPIMHVGYGLGFLTGLWVWRAHFFEGRSPLPTQARSVS